MAADLCAAVTPCAAALFVIGACPPDSVIGYSAGNQLPPEGRPQKLDSRHIPACQLIFGNPLQPAMDHVSNEARRLAGP